jgi:hypothetical protein
MVGKHNSTDFLYIEKPVDSRGLGAFACGLAVLLGSAIFAYFTPKMTPQLH